MSYSRWGSSVWYTYWCCQDKSTENRDTAIFDICGIKTFTAKQLREDLEGCIAEVVVACAGDGAKKPTSKELAELRKYVARFLADVDAEFRIDKPIVRDN